jgi:acyl-CoA thioesterase I
MQAREILNMKNIAILYGALLLACQVLVGCGPDVPQKNAAGQGEAAGAAAQEPAHLVVAFGDSLYAGYKLGPKEGFAPQLQAALRQKGYSVSVLNAGVSGDTSAAGRARLNFVLDNAPQKVEMVILGLGGNDMLRGMKPEETRDNLTAMLDELRRRKIEVVLTGMLASPNMGQDYERAFNPIYPSLAKQYGIKIYPFFLDGVITNGKLMLDDGIHPNADGVSQIVAKLEPMIAAALDD